MSKAASILVVDDEKDLVDLLSEYITDGVSRPVKITKAFHGLEALELANEHHFDLIVTDMRMPKLIGAELIRRLRSQENHKHTPFIVVTAYIEDAAGLPVKFKDVHLMAKPVDCDQFVKLLQTILA